MISDPRSLDRKINESIKRVKENYERLRIPTTPQIFIEILAEFSREIASNPLFEPYIKSIKEKEETYRQRDSIASIIQQATTNPIGQQILNQKMLARNEQISEYFSLWLILRFNELYDISLHEKVQNELKENNDVRGLVDFNEGITIISDILSGQNDLNLALCYLPYAHRVMSEIIQFFDKQQSIPDQHQNNSYNSSIKTEIFTDEQKSINHIQKGNLKAKDLFFDKTGSKIQSGSQTLVEFDNDNSELINFTASFFQDGKLTQNKLSLKMILKNLKPQTKSLLSTEEQETPNKTKILGDQDYEHIRYLKNKLNKLMKNHIEKFITLQGKKFYPRPDLFQ